MLFDVKSSRTILWGLTAKEVIHQLETGQIPLSCKIFQPLKQRWTGIPATPLIAGQLSNQLCNKSLSFSYNSLFFHWSLKNFLSDQGYFTLMNVVAKLQNNEIAKDSLINHPTLQKWKPIHSIEIFSEDSIRCLYRLGLTDGSFRQRTKARSEAKR